MLTGLVAGQHGSSNLQCSQRASNIRPRIPGGRILASTLERLYGSEWIYRAIGLLGTQRLLNRWTFAKYRRYCTWRSYFPWNKLQNYVIGYRFFFRGLRRAAKSYAAELCTISYPRPIVPGLMQWWRPHLPTPPHIIDGGENLLDRTQFDQHAARVGLRSTIISLNLEKESSAPRRSHLKRWFNFAIDILFSFDRFHLCATYIAHLKVHLGCRIDVEMWQRLCQARKVVEWINFPESYRSHLYLSIMEIARNPRPKFQIKTPTRQLIFYELQTQTPASENSPRMS